MIDDKIERIRLYKAIARLDKPISDSTHTLIEISFLVLRLTVNRQQKVDR